MITTAQAHPPSRLLPALLLCVSAWLASCAAPPPAQAPAAPEPSAAPAPVAPPPPPAPPAPPAPPPILPFDEAAHAWPI